MEYSLSLVVPIYNEEENIEKLISDFKSFFSDFAWRYEIIFVDDGSSDRSREIILDRKTENMRLVSHRKNRGYGEALKTGFRESKNGLIAYIDGDNQFNIESLDKLLKFIDNYDMIIGRRKVRNDDFGRQIISKGFNSLVRKFLDINFEDVDCGLKIFKREVFEQIELKTKRTVDAELLAKASKKDFHIKQIKVDHFSRDKGESEAKGLLGVRIGLIFITLKEIKSIHGDLKNG